jgi:transposase InsO family protein
VNIDVCFVPKEHQSESHLPAVSGSSGRLIRCHREPGPSQVTWPGKVFEETELTYEEAMQAYIAATRDRWKRTRSRPVSGPVEEPSARRKERERQEIWYQIRQRRQQEDDAWRMTKDLHTQALQTHRVLSRIEHKRTKAKWNDQQTAWQDLRQQHQLCLAERPSETAAWHERNRLSQQKDLTGATLPWIAILVITDNCSRQCLGLPLFLSGAHLTSQELVQALDRYLPPHLAFLISDQDLRFRSQDFAQLSQAHDFVHVLVYRHRPQTNGIAEHFVRTLKDRLQDLSWNSGDQLAPLLAALRLEYNDRPHQALPIPGLSPNEYAGRVWLF